jgi:hypothetical protein
MLPPRFISIGPFSPHIRSREGWSSWTDPALIVEGVFVGKKQLGGIAPVRGSWTGLDDVNEVSRETDRNMDFFIPAR